jgi:putative ABC transport system substrate-binding protein
VRTVIAATQIIPIVFTTGADPVAVGLVSSLNRPGGNVTGVTLIQIELEPKRLELLHEMAPAANKIALLADRNDPVSSRERFQAAQAAARRLGLEIVLFNCGTENEIETAFRRAARVEQPAGLAVR